MNHAFNFRKMITMTLILLTHIVAFSAQAASPSKENSLYKTLQEIEKTKGKASSDYILQLSEIGNYYYQIGNYTKAIEVFEEAVEISEENFGDYPELKSNFLGYLGMLYTNTAQYAEAKAAYTEMLHHQRKLKRISTPENYAQILGNAAVLFSLTGEYLQAKSFGLEALNILDQYQIKESETRSILYGLLGQLYMSEGNYQLSEQYFLKAIHSSQNKHAEYAKVVNNMGGLYFKMGLYEKSRMYFTEAYELKKKLLPNNHPSHGSSIGNIGLASTYLGDYASAEKNLLEALSRDENTLGKKHRNYANSIINLGHLYVEMGDYERAKVYIQQGTAVIKDILGPTHTDYAASLYTLGKLHIAMANYDNAIKYCKEALDIQLSIDKEFPESVSTMLSLGKCYLLNKSYDLAVETLNRSLQNTKEILGTTHSSYAECLFLLGLYYSETNNFSQAEYYYQMSLNAYKEIYSEKHSQYITCLNSLGELYAQFGHFEQAYQCFSSAFDGTKKHYAQSTNFMSERQRELYWETIRHRYESTYPSFAYNYYASHPEIAMFAYNNALFLKGLLLQSSTTIHNSILNSNNTSLINRWNTLQEMHVQILSLSEKEPSSSYLSELRVKAEKLEKELIESSAVFRDNLSQWDYSWESVRNTLSKNDVAIEFIAVPTSNNDKEYCALLLRHNSEYPIYIPLCKESELEVFLLNNPSEIYDYTHHGKDIFQLIWKPLIEHLHTDDNIHFSPAGYLHLLAIEYLPLDTHRFMHDEYNIKRLSSTRELIAASTPSVIGTASLYGGILYDMDAEELLAESEEYTSHQLGYRAVVRSANTQEVTYLPGTKTEIDYIHKVLTNNKIYTNILSGGKGTEESFKALDGQSSHILHLATHGFFWSDENAKTSEYYRHRTLTPELKSLPIDPLQRCGLLLSGANIALSGNQNALPEGLQDGILTAKEISLLDLNQTQVTVLSACETGKGEVTSDGVFGLQRALKQAGVQSIIMSLWPVDDTATQLLMQQFYFHWIKNKTDKHTAFQMAQKSVRLQFSDAKYWAGFVLLD